MERRKLLLGSGVGLATVLAGCSGEDLMSDDENESDENGNGNETPNGSDENGEDAEDGENGENGKDGKNGENGESAEDGDEKGGDKNGKRDVPGLDVDAFESLLEQQGITVETLRRSGPNLTLKVSVSDLNADDLSASADSAELRQRLSDIVSAAGDAVTDPQAFIAAIETITVSVLDGTDGKKKKGKSGLTVEVRVSWLIEFVRNRRSERELLDRITETASEGA
ncbi:hypothetical protein HT576_17415 [Haloterrigena sp. SYSU A121-1]|uniref:Uncharacterized protein n=1 Tax=Haloterrigena gelatinilytica TaxID=2741724 RepID=A0A8J8KFX6_9EURY|nr:hypothetical protein [Haloterrigena gelatinilytica]NUB92788.1 hypothetical protein [Haloterrigena gelatinilytica]